MLAITIALFAFSTPLGYPCRPHSVLPASNDYLVDVGYQLNQGHTVMVARYPLSDATKLELIELSTHE